MGFESFKEAYNVLGLSLGVKPASIKNYRDELDPLFPNRRRGWHGRPLRPHCEQVYESFKNHSMHELFSVIIKITGAPMNTSQNAPEEEAESFARRILTGRAAENFFAQNYREQSDFSDAEVEDVTYTGCGYDFRLSRADSNEVLAVEVKGLSTISGNIMLTDKEHDVAREWANRYFIYIVKNFNENPFAIAIRNPLNSDLSFQKKERKIIQISWSATV